MSEQLLVRGQRSGGPAQSYHELALLQLLVLIVATALSLYPQKRNGVSLKWGVKIVKIMNA
jgi:hypothetical protein